MYKDRNSQAHQLSYSSVTNYQSTPTNISNQYGSYQYKQKLIKPSSSTRTSLKLDNNNDVLFLRNTMGPKYSTNYDQIIKIQQKFDNSLRQTTGNFNDIKDKLNLTNTLDIRKNLRSTNQILDIKYSQKKPSQQHNRLQKIMDKYQKKNQTKQALKLLQQLKQLKKKQQQLKKQRKLQTKTQQQSNHFQCNSPINFTKKNKVQYFTPIIEKKQPSTHNGSPQHNNFLHNINNNNNVSNYNNNSNNSNININNTNNNNISHNQTTTLQKQSYLNHTRSKSPLSPYTKSNYQKKDQCTKRYSNYQSTSPKYQNQKKYDISTTISYTNNNNKYETTTNKYQTASNKYETTSNKYETTSNKYETTSNKYETTSNKYDSNNKYDFNSKYDSKNNINLNDKYYNKIDKQYNSPSMNKKVQPYQSYNTNNINNNNTSLLNSTTSTIREISKSPTPKISIINSPTNTNKYSTISRNSLQEPVRSITQELLTPSKSRTSSSKNSITSISSIKQSFGKRKVTINDFIIGKNLGQGKFGIVYQAFDKKTKGIYALKKVPKSTIKSHWMIDQFILQVKLQAFLNHPNILGLVHTFDDTDHVYILLQYMQQGTLFLQLKKNQILGQKQAAIKLKQIALAIQYLHENNIAHRDIKPQNIVMSHGVCKLCDFGWATICDQRRKTYCGTFDYAAPEILQGTQYDFTVDLWCLGILAYEILVGKAPFYHISRKQTMKKIMNVQNQKINYPSTMSRDARSFIEQLLRKNPQERLKSQNLLDHPFLKNVQK